MKPFLKNSDSSSGFEQAMHCWKVSYTANWDTWTAYTNTYHQTLSQPSNTISITKTLSQSPKHYLSH